MPSFRASDRFSEFQQNAPPTSREINNANHPRVNRDLHSPRCQFISRISTDTGSRHVHPERPRVREEIEDSR